MCAQMGEVLDGVAIFQSTGPRSNCLHTAPFTSVVRIFKPYLKNETDSLCEGNCFVQQLSLAISHLVRVRTNTRALKKATTTANTFRTILLMILLHVLAEEKTKDEEAEKTNELFKTLLEEVVKEVRCQISCYPCTQLLHALSSGAAHEADQKRLSVGSQTTSG